MTHSRAYARIIEAGFVLAGLLAVACIPAQTPQVLPATPATRCTYRHSASGSTLPDSTCTPGVIDPNVTQANIDQTICRAGYTATVRPSAQYTESLKLRQMVMYGATAQPGSYEEDHLIPLELGGHPSDPRNLWPQPGTAPNPKDRVENELHQRVCSGRMLLAEAQHRIASDWTIALNGL